MRDPFEPYDDTIETDPAYARPSKPHWRTDPRQSSEYVTLRKQYREQCRMHRNADGSYGKPCDECHQRIDYRLSWPHPLSFSLDHLYPIIDRPDLALVVANFRATHWKCNRSKAGRRHGDNEDDLDLGEPSEAW